MNKNNRQEQGRSMVEMLGVLAVVGVLSAGGIAGYTYAMDRHRTNELLNEASKRAVIVAAQIATGREPSLREFEDNTTAGGTISTEPATDIDGGVGIKVSGVKESVCKNLVKLDSETVYISKDDDSLTELNESDCSGDSNEFLIVFENMGGDTTTGCSKKVNKIYFTGECCSEKQTGLFCPDEVPPSCTVAAEKNKYCFDSCFGPSDSQFCCLSAGNIWTQTGDCCVEVMYNPAEDKCCSSEYDGKFCCEAFGYKYDEINNDCCFYPGASESCCTTWYGSDGRYDKDGICCRSGNYDESSDVCTD